MGSRWPALPPFSVVSWSLLTGAFAVAAIVLVQGVGVAESAPNEDGTRSDANTDFIAQGIGNIGSGVFQGQPVGGSVGQTALNRSAGATTRWASIFSGLWVLLILALFSGVVGRVAMPTLAALLIYAAIGSLRLAEATTVWRTGLTSQIAIGSTFISTLALPVAAAEDHLPDPAGTTSPALVLRMRGRTTLGATSLTVLANYARQLDAVDGRLYLAGLDASLIEQARRTGAMPESAPVRLYGAGAVVGAASLEAFHDAQAWADAQGEGRS